MNTNLSRIGTRQIAICRSVHWQVKPPVSRMCIHVAQMVIELLWSICQAAECAYPCKSLHYYWEIPRHWQLIWKNVHSGVERIFSQLSAALKFDLGLKIKSLLKCPFLNVFSKTYHPIKVNVLGNWEFNILFRNLWHFFFVLYLGTLNWLLTSLKWHQSWRHHI